MGTVTQKQLDEFEATHKRIAHLKGKDGAWEAVLRRPTRVEYKHYRAQMANPSQASDAQEHLFRKLCIVPSTIEGVDALLDEWPAIPEAAGKMLIKLMGLETEDPKG